ARGRVHGEPPARCERSIHDRDGNEDAVHWSGMTARKEIPNHPLTGIRVVEVGIYMAGPFCAMQLADLGADVIKVENPDGGDIARDSAPFLDGESSAFIRLNRNKRSLAMNLKAPEGKELFRELVRGADVVVENLRPGTMGDLELDYLRLSALNPGLVYVAASGWGQTGPYSQLAGLDIMAQAMSGLMSITGEPDGDPGRRRLLHRRRHHSTQLAVILRCPRPPGVGERRAFQGQPLAPRAAGCPHPDDRTGDGEQAAGALGVAAAGGGRALRRDPDLRSGFQRPAAAGARLLLERTTLEAGRRRADRFPDPFLGHASAARAGRPGAGRAHFGGAAGAWEDGGRDLGTQGKGGPGRDMSENAEQRDEPELLEEGR